MKKNKVWVVRFKESHYSNGCRKLDIVKIFDTEQKAKDFVRHAPGLCYFEYKIE